MTLPNAGEVPRHVVIFDCNVYLDVAELVGSPFSWTQFSATSAQQAKAPLPHPNRAVDSLRAIAACTSGRFAGNETLEVWTSAHIDMMVRGKAGHPVTPNSSGYRGLGWSSDDAQGLLEELVYGLVERSDGGTLGDCFPDGNPPLDHEDGLVYGACRELAGDDPLARIYCITRDREFLAARISGALSDHTRVLTPAQFVGLIRAARAHYATGRMPRGL